MRLPPVAIIWHKRIAKFYIICWRVEVSMFSKTDCQNTRPCCLKLKLSRKLSFSHNCAVVVRIIRSNNEYAHRNAISRIFKEKLTTKANSMRLRKKFRQRTKSNCQVWMWYSKQFSTNWQHPKFHQNRLTNTVFMWVWNLEVDTVLEWNSELKWATNLAKIFIW